MPVEPRVEPPIPPTSVLGLGVSPWMRGVSAQSAVPPPLNTPFNDDAQLVSVGQTASLFHEVETVQDKEKRTAARKRAREDKKEEEIELEEVQQENLVRCKWYFYLGCFGLPFLHFVNAYYFIQELKGDDRDFKIKKYIYLSLIVGIIETFIWILWVVVFQLLRDSSLKSVNILNFNYTVGSLV